MGKLATRRGDYEAARKQIERSLKICQEIGERDLMARCLNGLGAASRLSGNYAQAEAEHQQSLSIYNEIGVNREIPFTLNNLGRVALDQEDYQRAQDYFQESLHLSQELENKTEMASAWRHLGHLAGVMEREAEARRYYCQALEIVTKTGEAPVALDVFLGWASLLRRSHPTLAVEMASFVQTHPAVTHETLEKAHRLLPDTAAGLPTETISQAQSEGQHLDWQTRAIQLIENLASVS